MDGDDDATAARTKLDSPRWKRGTSDATGSEPTVTAPAPARPGAFDRLRHRYAIGEELGRGGMGRVLAATDTALERPVAIKQALSDSPDLLARFAREARITARLGHPAIVPVYDSGRDDDGHPYYVMRQIDGEPLADKVHASTPLRDRLALIPNVLSAVDATAFAHAKRIVHRDIKPWNILVGAYGETLLIDWGLARELDEPDAVPGVARDSGPALTRAGKAYGTAGFMAPEQARGEAVDARADVYALGATLCFVLVGDSQIIGSDTAWIEHAARGDAASPLARIPDGVPTELTAIVAKAMAYAPADRYADAGELAADLRRFLAGQLVAAHRYTWRERLARFVRRHRVAVVAVTLAALTTVAIGTYAIANVVRERDAADGARAAAERGRVLANDRADDQLVDRAARLAQTDPTRAVALLRELPPESKQWPAARDIAAIAATHGIAHGAREHRAAIKVLAFAKDGHRLLSASDDEVHVRDLASNQIQTRWKAPAGAGAITGALWALADRAIVVTLGTGIVVVDVASGTPRVLDPTARTETPWLSGDGAVLYYRDPATATLVTLPLAGGPPTKRVDDVRAVAAAGDIAIVAGTTGSRLVVRGQVAHQLTTTADAAVAASAVRVAAITPTGVAEWSTDTGAELARTTPIPGTATLRIEYGTGGLLEVRSSGLRHALTREGRLRFDGSWGAAWFSRTHDLDVVLADDGTLAILDATSLVKLSAGPVGTRVVAGSPDGGYVAAGTIDGVVMWWDVDAALPARIPLEQPVTPCGFAGARVVVASDADLASIDLGKHELTRFEAPPMSRCVGVLGSRAIVAGPDQLTAIDAVTGARIALGPAGLLATDPTSATLYVADGPQVDQLGPDATAPEPAWTLPAPIEAVAANGGALAVQLATHELRHRDSAGGVSTAPLPGPVSAIVIEAREVWFARDRELWRWQPPAAPSRVATLEQPATLIVAAGAGGVSLVLADRSLWSATATSLVQRQPAGPAGEWRLGRRVAVFNTFAAVTEVFLATGQRVTHEMPTAGGGVALSADERTLAVSTVSRPTYLAVLRDTVPEVASLRRWLEDATNAVIVPGTDALTWPTN